MLLMDPVGQSRVERKAVMTFFEQPGFLNFTSVVKKSYIVRKLDE